MEAEAIDALKKKLPDSTILWDVPFRDKMLASNVQKLEVRELTEWDIQMLKYFENLQVLDGRNCDNLDVLIQAQRMYPKVQVLYTVTINGTNYSQDARCVKTSNLTERDVAAMTYLSELAEVFVSDCKDYALLQLLQQQFPQWNLTYLVSIGGEYYASDTKEITVQAATEADLDCAMQGFTKLERVTLINPETSAAYLIHLREEYPEIEIYWRLEVKGVTYTDDLTEVDISHMPLESLKQAETIGSYFPKMEKLIVDSGSIDNDTMAAFREKMRSEYKVVWTVVCGTPECGMFEVRTDETTFMPLKHGIYYFHDDDIYNVRYCEDMVCVDVGHMTFKDVSFVEKMPHLKYLILNFTSVKDITPLSSCKELVFLELDHSWVTDYSPLLGCTALEDLNLGDTYGDPEPIAQMTWLKNLWWVGRSVSVKTYLEQTLTDTYLLFRPNTKQTTSFGWRKLPNYYAMRDLLGMYYMD